jgi:hypothetical protein
MSAPIQLWSPPTIDALAPLFKSPCGFAHDPVKAPAMRTGPPEPAHAAPRSIISRSELPDLHVAVW